MGYGPAPLTVSEADVTADWPPPTVKTQWNPGCSPGSQGVLCSDPCPVHVTVPSANATEGKMAHAIINSVAAVTAIRPAVVSRLLSFVLVRCEPIICSNLPFALPVGTAGGYLLSHY